MMSARFFSNRSWIYGSLIACVWAALIVEATAASPALKSARATLNEGLPLIAVEKVKRILKSSSLDLEDRRDAIRLLGEALLAAGHAEMARSVLAPLVSAGDSEARLLEAHSFAREGEWAKARSAYAALAADPKAPLAARVGEAESLQAMGETSRALEILAPLLSEKSLPVEVRIRAASLYVEDQQLAKARQLLSTIKVSNPSDKMWARYVDGRILLAEHQMPAALAQFSRILEPSATVSENLVCAATLGASEAKAKLEGLEAADKKLETFIWRNPDSPWLELVFQRLDQVYAGEKNPTEDELRKWASRAPTGRAALARYYHGRLQAHFKKWDKVQGTLEPFARLYPNHRLLPLVHLLRADAFLALEQLTEAVSALDSASRNATTDEQRAEIELRTGLVQFRQRELVLAANSFQQAAERSPKIADIARYNAALSWLGQGNEVRFGEQFDRLGDRPETTTMRRALAIEHGLTQAREGRPEAGDSLRKFLSESPNHPRAQEARLALAELNLATGSTDGAARWLKIATDKPHNETSDDQAAYLAIFLADSKTPRNDAEVIRLGNAFVNDRPKSPLVPEVRMKLGQVYFRQSDYPHAEEQFERLAREFPTNDYSETTLFLAGQCAMRTLNPGSMERGLKYFDQVAERNGPLKFQAREQQALIHVQMKKENEAVALYDFILAGKPPAVDADLRASATIGKCDALMALGKADATKLDVALTVVEQLATDPDATAKWRYQALYKKGKVLEALGRPNEMVEAYNEVLDLNLNGATHDYFWFYQCGFEAARYFERRQNWSSAIAMLEKIARLKGPRDTQAADNAKRLRLEHFIWE
jgi:tetratricopeptide (TPR) repeat protein